MVNLHAITVPSDYISFTTARIEGRPNYFQSFWPDPYEVRRGGNYRQDAFVRWDAQGIRWEPSAPDPRDTIQVDDLRRAYRMMQDRPAPMYVVHPNGVGPDGNATAETVELARAHAAEIRRLRERVDELAMELSARDAERVR